MKNVHTWSAKEIRLIWKGDIRQLGRDINDFHLRADDPLALAGSVVMAPVVAFSKIGNAIVGQFSDVEAEPLEEGGFKYMQDDVRSAAENILATGKNLVTLHPIKALGNAVKAGFDAFDILTVDPFLDLVAGATGHQKRKTRNSLARTFDTAA